MLDFAALPPEVNSARIYAGPGSGPMMAAATAWDALAGQLESFAGGYSSELTALQGHAWSGPASTAMAAAAEPYVAWASTTAAQAEQAASQARAAAAAYEAAFAATVPPPVIAANRALLATLVATNFFGQNTPAIAATEAHYAEMWAQDATAMYGYAGSSLPAAATLTPFNQPPNTTNPGGQSAQSAAAAHALGTGATQTARTALAHALPNALHPAHSLSGSTGAHSLSASSGTHGLSASSGTAPSTSPSGSNGVYYIHDWSSFKHVYDIIHKSLFSPFYNEQVTVGDVSQFGAQSAMFGRHLGLPDPALALLGKGALASSTTGDGGTVLASTGKAASAGSLSVPQTWTGAASTTKVGYVAQSAEPQAPATAQRAVAARLVNAGSEAPGMNQMPPPVGAPARGSAQRHGGNAVIRMRERRFAMPRPTVGG